MGNTLIALQQLTPNQQLTSPNGRSFLSQQNDGNLVLYRKDNNAALWTAWTNDNQLNYSVMQQDGSFVVLSPAPANKVLWSSGTQGNPGAYLKLDDNGNLTVYSSANRVLWSTNSIQWDLAPSTVAAHAIWGGWPAFNTPGQVYSTVPGAPGWEYKLRVNGNAYADAPFGLAQIATALQMTNDTIIHVASMSKPVCVTAFVAMLDDWTDLANGVKGTGPLAATRMVEIVPPPIHPPVVPSVGSTTPLPLPKQVSADVPQWLLPALSSAPLAKQLVDAGLLAIVPTGLQAIVNDVALRSYLCVPPSIVPPGYTGLLGQVIKGVAVPTGSDDFLPLLQSNLQSKAASLGLSFQPGLNMGKITIEQLITHNSTLPSTGIAATILQTIPSAATSQPSNGGPATCDIWAYLVAFLGQAANGQTGYKNDDYNVLGGVVAACVGTDYDDYVYARLFSDPQFGALRRYVTNSAIAANYYIGNETNLASWPTFTAGNPFPDYRGFGASGGFYYTADQITQWLYVLYARANVQLATGASGPLLSSTGWSLLFGPTTPYFAAGVTNTVSGWTTYTHNGATSIGTGSCNGNMGIAVAPAPSKDVITAFFCANGSMDGAAPFNAALAEILQYTPPA